jgi:hypothetical protein
MIGELRHFGEHKGVMGSYPMQSTYRAENNGLQSSDEKQATTVRPEHPKPRSHTGYVPHYWRLQNCRTAGTIKIPKQLAAAQKG